MAQTFRGTLRRWGSSIAVVVPPDVAQLERVHVGDEVEVCVRRPLTLRDLFGAIPGASKGFLRRRNEERRVERESQHRRWGQD